MALLHDRYGIKPESDAFRLSKFDLNKLMEMQRRNWELKDSQKQALVAVADPIDEHEQRIWKDRSYRANEKARNENAMAGHVGNLTFDNENLNAMEKRFQDNINQKKRFVLDNALRAQAKMQIANNSLYNAKSE